MLKVRWQFYVCLSTVSNAMQFLPNRKKSRVYIFGDLHPGVRDEDHCVRFYAPSWCLSAEHVESSRFCNRSHRCRQHSSVQFDEGWLRREGFESLPSPQAAKAGVRCSK
ncbi:uncharacterized protein CEXT_575251 [Caerostris extrusa]|uniref:Secreted protein n=1 Tax=Caerostris extrusa TaxID=172846 RepID=A0AAV4PW42_CAEEX|nr:uncharacterized protein CEXT_575251 [Caerostris extrusa]